MNKFIAVTVALDSEESALPVINDLVRANGIGPIPTVFLYKDEKGYVVWRRAMQDDEDYTKKHPETRKWRASWADVIPGEVIAEY